MRRTVPCLTPEYLSHVPPLYSSPSTRPPITHPTAHRRVHHDPAARLAVHQYRHRLRPRLLQVRGHSGASGPRSVLGLYPRVVPGRWHEFTDHHGDSKFLFDDRQPDLLCEEAVRPRLQQVRHPDTGTGVEGGGGDVCCGQWTEGGTVLYVRVSVSASVSMYLCLCLHLPYIGRLIGSVHRFLSTYSK